MVVYGANWCLCCWDAQLDLRKLGVPFVYKRTDDPDSVCRARMHKAKMLDIQDGDLNPRGKYPCCLFPDGSHLTAPTHAELENKCRQLGLVHAFALVG